MAVSDATTLLRDLRDRALDIVITRWTSSAVADDLTAEVLFNARSRCWQIGGNPSSGERVCRSPTR